MKQRLNIVQLLTVILVAINALGLHAEEIDTTNLSNLCSFDYETIVLKDGTRLYGYVASELADGSICFNTLISTRTASRIGLEHQYKYYSREQLPHHVSHSLKKYEPFVQTLRLNATLQLAKLPHYPIILETELDGDSIMSSNIIRYSIEKPEFMEDILVLEESMDSIRYLSFLPAKDNIEYSDIKERLSADLPPHLGYGLFDRVITSDENMYVGRITRRSPGKSIVITSEGTDKTIPLEKVNITEKIGADPNKPISAQTPFITDLLFKGGKSIRGTIILMNYESGEMVIVTDINSDTIQGRIDNLEKRSYKINSNYPPKKAIKLDYSASKIYADTTLLTPLNLEISKKGLLNMKKIDIKSEATALNLSGDSLSISLGKLQESAITLTPLTDPQHVGEISLYKILAGSAPETRLINSTSNATFCTFKNVRKGYYILSLLKEERFYLLKIE